MADGSKCFLYVLQVHSWVLWNASTVCQPLCEELSSDARGAADTAERVLFGTLEALLRGPVASHTDPRARWARFLPALSHIRYSLLSLLNTFPAKRQSLQITCM
jgi:hypothetical protein